MYRYEDIQSGATVYCSDGRLGTVQALAHEPERGEVIGLLVAGVTQGRLVTVPIESVDRVPSPNRVILNVECRGRSAFLVEEKAATD